ncbi:MAG TPA: universal stress protein [Chloroflexota bacterium]|nr:universal stress protein [Chloroflexota bacterium]
MAYRNIVVAVHGTPASDVALHRAIGIARAEHAELTVLGVDEPLPPFAPGGEGGRRNGQLHAAVEAAVGTARRSGVEVQGQVLSGYPAEAIVQYCETNDCDLLVVGAGNQRPGPVGRTADKVVGLAPCGVLVAR